jgi:hypothetical protein
MSIRLPERVGLAAAKRLMFTSGQVSATEALALGRVDQVAPDAQLDEAVDSLASQISANSPHANRIIKSCCATARQAAHTGARGRAHAALRASRRPPRATLPAADQGVKQRASAPTRRRATPGWSSCTRSAAPAHVRDPPWLRSETGCDAHPQRPRPGLDLAFARVLGWPCDCWTVALLAATA